MALGIDYNSGIPHTNGAPTHDPGTNGGKVAYDHVAKTIYRHVSGTDWEAYPTGGGGGGGYQSDTYANWNTKRVDGELPLNTVIVVTDRGDTGMQLTTTDDPFNIGFSGVAGFLNADFQAVGDYSGVEAETGVAAGTQLGIWRAAMEDGLLSLYFKQKEGGVFSIGDVITGAESGATATVESVSANLLTLSTVSGDYSNFEQIANGDGVTAILYKIDAINVTTGDIVIYDLKHYQCIDVAMVDGNAPSVNSAAYTELPRTMANAGYIEEWDNIEFDFQNDWLQYRADSRGNKYTYTFTQDLNGQELTYSAISEFQWGNNIVSGNTIDGAVILEKNSAFASFSGNSIGNGVFISDNDFLFSFFFNNVFLVGGEVSGNVFTCSSFGLNDFLGYFVVSSNNFNNATFSGNVFYQDVEITGCNFSPRSTIQTNVFFPFATIVDVTVGEACSVNANILENTGSITGITAGANCSISRNKIGQGATMGGSTTMGDGAVINDNELHSSATMSGNTLADTARLISNKLGSEASISNNAINSFQGIVYNDLASFGQITDCTLDGTGQVSSCYLGISAAIANKTFDSAGISNFVFAPEIYYGEAETISAGISNKRVEYGFSNFEASIDITGLTTLDYTAPFQQYVGILTLSSSNATEVIDEILNPPTLFPFILKPAAGLVLIISGTDVSGIAAGQFALSTKDLILDGNKGEYAQFEIDPFGTGYVVETKRVILI